MASAISFPSTSAMHATGSGLTNEPTVFVVDDDHDVRRSLDTLIRSIGIAVRAYESAADFLNAYQPDRPGCLILDLRMPGMSGLELQTALRERRIDIPTIIITGHGDVPVAVRALKNGAFEFLEKPFSRQLLLEHIQNAIKLDADRRTRRARRDSIAARIEALTQRERQVMQLVAAGKASKEVAAELGLSKKTIDLHRAHVMQKLRAASLAELVEFAIEAREIDSTSPA